MKLIITENQYRILTEQSMVGWGKDLPPEVAADAAKGWSKSLGALSLDDTVDYVSGMIDVIPGIGNLISAGIDVVHSLSYAIRFYYAKNDNEKIEMGTLGAVTLIGAAIPVAGNALPIVARQGVKTVLKQTPKEILIIGKELGIYKGTMIFLSKEKWKYSILLALSKITGGELAEYLTNAVKYVRDLILKIPTPDIKKILKSFETFLNELLNDKDSITTAKKISKNLK
jgi:hypothetical protein